MTRSHNQSNYAQSFGTKTHLCIDYGKYPLSVAAKATEPVQICRYRRTYTEGLRFATTADNTAEKISCGLRFWCVQRSWLLCVGALTPCCPATPVRITIQTFDAEKSRVLHSCRSITEEVILRMAFKVSSLLVWLLATLSLTATVLQRVAAQDCTEELSACEADTVCAECTAVDDTFNQVYEECMASQYYYSNCDNYLLKACCQHQASENDCLANEMFVTVWWCYLPGCTYTFPGVASCSDILGVSVTSNGVSDPGTTPAPIAAPGKPPTQSLQNETTSGDELHENNMSVWISCEIEEYLDYCMIRTNR